MWKNLRHSRHMTTQDSVPRVRPKVYKSWPTHFLLHTRTQRVSRLDTGSARVAANGALAAAVALAAICCRWLWSSGTSTARWLIELRNPVRDDEELDDAFSGFMIERRRAQEKERLRGVEQQRIQKRNAQRKEQRAMERAVREQRYEARAPNRAVPVAQRPRDAVNGRMLLGLKVDVPWSAWEGFEVRATMPSRRGHGVAAASPT